MEDLIWVRENLKTFKPEDFYKKMKYSHISREKAEQRLREILNLIKSESSKVNRMKASYLIDNFESWVQTTDCESYWLDLEDSFNRKKHQMVGRDSAYKTIKTFTKKITDEEEAINELQLSTKRIKDNKLELQTPEDMIEIFSDEESLTEKDENVFSSKNNQTIYTNERLTSSADAKRTNEEFRLFKRQKIRDENKENSDDEDNDSWAPPSPTPQLPPQLPSQSHLSESSITLRPRLILKSGKNVKNLLNGVPLNRFWNGYHLILDRDNGWLLNYMEIEDFEEIVEICYSHGAVEVPMELKNMLKTLMNEKTVRSLREMQLSMQRQLNLDDILFYQKKWILSTIDNWLDYIELSSKNPLIKINSESHKSASIYYSLIDRLAIQYFRALRAGSSSESSSFTLHTVDANLHGKQPDIYFRDDILKIEPGNVEIAKDDMIKDTDKYDLDTNKSLRENIYEIHYAYDSLPTSKKEKIFEMDFMSFVISDNHIDTYATRLVDHQLYISTKVYDMIYPTEFAVNMLVGCIHSILKMVLRMNQTVETMRKAKVDDSDPLIDSPRKFKYFCDPRISPPIAPVTTAKKSGSSKKNVNKNTTKKTKNK